MKFLIFPLFILLCSCVATKWDGTLTQNGKAIKVTMKEGGSGITVSHYEISLNGEYVGDAKTLDKTLSKETFKPINTKFGVLKIVWNVNWQIMANSHFDFYLDDEFVGTVEHPAN